jgi:hypothetical protein
VNDTEFFKLGASRVFVNLDVDYLGPALKKEPLSRGCLHEAMDCM